MRIVASIALGLVVSSSWPGLGQLRDGSIRSKAPKPVFHPGQLALAALGDQKVLPEGALILASREGTKIAHGDVANPLVVEIDFAVPGYLVSQIPAETFKAEDDEGLFQQVHIAGHGVL